MPRILKDIKKYFRYSLISADAQLKSEVANSYLNWIWWILEPLCMMLVYAFIFGRIFGMKTENYVIFIFLGLTIFDFFSRGIKSSVKIVKRNKQIVSKVYIPKFILIMSDLFVSGFKMLICMGVVFVMMAAQGTRFSPSMLVLIPVIIDLYLFTFACCTFLAHFGVFVEDLSNTISIVLKLLFYFTGIFYSIPDRFPKEYADIVLNSYPAAKLITIARDACLEGKAGGTAYLLALFAVSAVLAAVGIHIIYKNENAYVKLI